MKNEYTKLILKAGLVLGLILAAITFLGYAFFGSNLVGALVWILQIGAVIWVFISYGKQGAALKDIDNNGYTYGQAFGFSIMIMLLAGLIMAIANCLLVHVIDPAFYQEQMDNAMATFANYPGLSEEMLQNQIETVNFWRSPIMLILSSMLGTVIFGGLIALVTSSFIKRKPKI